LEFELSDDFTLSTGVSLSPQLQTIPSPEQVQAPISRKNYSSGSEAPTEDPSLDAWRRKRLSPT
jgi:hypothetical protein